MRNVVILGALLCAVALSCVEARATTAIQLTSEEQIAVTRAIVIGRCTKIESRNLDGRIYTYITLDVRDVLKGPVVRGELVIKQIGGEVGELGEWIYGSPRFDVGRDSLVFLSTNDENSYVVAGLFMGNFYLERDAAGREWARRDDGGEGARVLKRPGVVADDPLAHMALDDLRSLVAQDVAASKTIYDLVPHQIPVEYTRYFEGESSVVPSFVLLYNQRWFEPDSGQAVPFYVNPDNFDPQGAAIPDLSAAVRDSLNAWSTIPNCSMRYEFMGVNTDGCGWGRPIDGVSRVSIDCHNEIAGEGCRSIIAIGGGHYTSRETVVINGQTFKKIYEADVCLQDGWCDYFQDPTSLREVITHELGHCLGLSHSADTSASMAAFIHDDGRGSTIRPDDMEGAQFIYPAADDPGGGDPGGGDPGGDPEPPVIATGNLPDATVGVVYTSVFAVTNGKAPFEWSLTSGALPVGIALSGDGRLGGAATQSGTYSFSIRVTDSLGRVDGKFLTIKVRVPAPVVLAADYRPVKKQLTIVGTNFATSAQFEINGQVVIPRKTPTFNTSTGTFVIKGSRKQLRLNKGAGANQLVIIVEGERSVVYTF